MDIVCYSHLRWNFVYQRPQHLLSRFAKRSRVFFIEEPVNDCEVPWLEVQQPSSNLHIVIPHLNRSTKPHEAIEEQRILFQKLIASHSISEHIAWLYTPMALPLMEAFPYPRLVVYDCMDELSGFDNAPEGLQEKERILMERADIVFTGGFKLFSAKKSLHENIHPFPSSIDKEHFGKARIKTTEPEDQAGITGLRLGFFGVIDERLDIELIDELSSKKPEWNIILVGPTVKINPDILPRRDNIHYLGGKSYNELPVYLSGWDVALIPFALNRSTEFISPTKTPEYLAGGKPVISTPIHDVINPYGKLGLAYIASNADEFIKGVDWALESMKTKTWLNTVDYFLKHSSWDDTWKQMNEHIESCLLKTKTSIGHK